MINPVAVARARREQPVGDTLEEGAPSPKRDKGFTLVELLIVIVILGILATVTVFAVRGITQRGEESACDADRSTLESAAEAYYAQEGEYPANELALVTEGFIRDQSEKWEYVLGPRANDPGTPEDESIAAGQYDLDAVAVECA